MGKIDIRDLSVGDWVFHDDIVFGREIAKVHRLNKDNNGETIGITVYRSDGAFGVVGYILTSPTNNDIYPIPLTLEILEKNGFRLVVVNKKFNDWHDNNITIRKYYNEDNYHLFVCGQKIEFKMLFIHQLQHALRLAKTGKEITL